jgi:hypothetical protein
VKSYHVAISARIGVAIAWLEQSRSLSIDLVRLNAIRSCCATTYVVSDILADRSVHHASVIVRFGVDIGNVISPAVLLAFRVRLNANYLVPMFHAVGVAMIPIACRLWTPVFAPSLSSNRFHSVICDVQRNFNVDTTASDFAERDVRAYATFVSQ